MGIAGYISACMQALTCWFSLSHYMFLPTWSSSGVADIYMLERFCFTVFVACRVELSLVLNKRREGQDEG
jgi:hypothetical protein